jgi:hypothetical protein
LQPYVHWYEVKDFINIFYPSKDPAAMSLYNGKPITFAFPQEEAPLKPQRFDIFPVLDLLALSQIPCAEVYAMDCPPEATLQAHDLQVFESLFAPANSLCAYLTMPTAYPIEKVMFRPYQRRPRYRRAILEIWFEPPPADSHDLEWVDGKDWIWPDADPLSGTRFRATSERRKRHSIWRFLNDAGLYHQDIRQTWHVRLGIVGRHSKGGLGTHD